jgi:hypothetical protein
MHAAAPAALWAAWDECTCAGAALFATFSLNCGFLPRSCCAVAHSTVLSVLGSLLSRLGEARHPARVLLAPALIDGDAHPLRTSPSIPCRGNSPPRPRSFQVLSCSLGGHEGSAQRKPQGPARPHGLFSSHKPTHTLPCASRTWLRIRRGKRITNTPCWVSCDQA